MQSFDLLDKGLLAFMLLVALVGLLAQVRRAPRNRRRPTPLPRGRLGAPSPECRRFTGHGQ